MLSNHEQIDNIILHMYYLHVKYINVYTAGTYISIRISMIFHYLLFFYIQGPNIGKYYMILPMYFKMSSGVLSSSLMFLSKLQYRNYNPLRTVCSIFNHYNRKSYDACIVQMDGVHINRCNCSDPVCSCHVFIYP